MAHEATYDFEDEDHFWAVLDETVSKECNTHSSIDDTLRSYISLIGSCRERFLPADIDLGRCAIRLQDSELFATHAEYIRRQFVHCLIEDDEPNVVLVATSFLIAHARSHERIYELLNDEGAFTRLIDLIGSPRQHGHGGMHRLLMELLYEMSRIQKIKNSDLAHIGDDFVKMMFEIIEQVSDDVNDPYHYPTIRVLLVLNEQFMVAAHDPTTSQTVPLTNKVIKVLSTHGSAYKTFGENIILLLNREDETSLQLLTLKLLYLLFTTPPTYEYFYTNDLRVLVDILVRNLLDLPEEASSLRHTYLRVLYPLLEHTQLQNPPHYKRDEIRRLLTVLGGGHLSDPANGNEGLHHWGHFDDVDETTKRLVKRCEGVSWLIDPDTEPPVQAESPTDDLASGPSSPTSPSKAHPPALPAPRKLKKRNSSKASTLTIGQYLTPELEGARKSSLSMLEVAAQKEKPGVMTPSRNPGLKNNLRAAIIHKKEKPPPPVPQARRSGWTRMRAQRQESEAEIAKAEVSSPDTDTKPESAAPHHLPFHHLHHHHHHHHSRTASAPTATEKEQHQPPPIPTHHKGHFKKPPPMPKARRKRGSGTSNGEREPGKFDPKLPSIVTTTTTGVVEQSPFSPSQKTLSPSEQDSASTMESRTKLPVSQALEAAQAQALDEITESFEHVDIEAEFNKELDEDGDDDEEDLTTVGETEGGQQGGDVIEEEEEEEEGEAPDDPKSPRKEAGKRPDISRAHSQEDMDQQFHDAVLTQPLSEGHIPTPSHSTDASPLPSASPFLHPEEMSTPPELPPPPDIATPATTTMPRMVLTPPAQEPSRGIPGPLYALERSPFLTDEEVDDGDDVESGVDLAAEADSEVEDETENENEDLKPSP